MPHRTTTTLPLAAAAASAAEPRLSSHSSSASRALGRSGLHVSALGLGTWPIGGPMFLFGANDSYGPVDDAISVKAIHAALAHGVTFFDSADCYGAGHSEEVLGRALAGRRDRCVIATKFGYAFDAVTKNIHGEDVRPEAIRRACHASLQRLRTDYIDLYQIHTWDVSPEKIEPMVETLEQLCDEGLIRAYGWSTDLLERVRPLATRDRFVALQHESNVFDPNEAALALCKQNGWASLARSPLAMGLLGGNYRKDTRVSVDSARGSGMSWVKYFREGRPSAGFLRRLDAVRDILTSGGRTLAQGALAYLWAKSPITVPIPGFRTVEQAVGNAQAMAFGPLRDDQVSQIETALNSPAAEAEADA